MSVQGAVMVPHPPLIIPEVGRGQEQGISSTVKAYRRAMERLASWRPDTVVVLSPHAVMYLDYFHISPGKEAEGSFARFGAGQVKVRAVYDAEFARKLSREAERVRVLAGTLGERDPRLDHGTMIPLWFLDPYLPEYRVVRIGLSGLPLTAHYRLGQCIQKAARELGRRVAVVASGDLSHRLKEDGPYGFQKEGPEYDQRVMEVMGKADFGQLLDFSEGFCEKAAECGHRSFVIMAGALDCLDVEAERLSYEGPFGVGYGVCVYEAKGENPSRDFLRQQEEKEAARRKIRRLEEDTYVRLARHTVEHYIRTGKRLEAPDWLPQEMKERRAGVFVSLKEDGQLRGCIGTIAPVRESLAQEIISNAVSAATQDPRFPAVREDELDRLVYSVDVLGEPEEIASLAELDMKRYGVIVSRGSRRGLLLPDLEGVDTAEEQVAIAKRKAGIPADAQDVRLERFQVVRHL